MKKLFIIVSVFTPFIQAMEITPCLTVAFNNTTINLTQCSLSQINKDINLLVVGARQQHSLTPPSDQAGFIQEKPNFGTRKVLIGNVYYPTINIVYEKNKGNDHVSTKKLWKNAHTLEMPCTVMNIVEPLVEKTGNYLFYSCPTKKSPYWQGEEFGEKAVLPTASEHLIFCYKTALQEGLEKLHDKKKNIALTTLGANIGFFPEDKAAPKAIEAIFEFLKENPNTYNLIELIVSKDSEYELYKKLLQEEHQ